MFLCSLSFWLKLTREKCLYLSHSTIPFQMLLTKEKNPSKDSLINSGILKTILMYLFVYAFRFLIFEFRFSVFSFRFSLFDFGCVANTFLKKRGNSLKASNKPWMKYPQCAYNCNLHLTCFPDFHLARCIHGKSL
jgi:hypothetical protein